MTDPNLTIYRDLDQGTDEWLTARRGLLTASVIGQLISPGYLRQTANETSRALLNRLAAERLTGRVEYMHPSRDMERGTLDEPHARAAYEQRTGTRVDQVGLMVREHQGARLGYSPDGLVGDDGLIEIKSRRPYIQVLHHIKGVVPAPNLAQVQAGLWVTRRPWLDYVSYCGGLPLLIVRVEPDPRWQEAITAAVIRAETEISGLVTAYREASAGLPPTEYVDHYADLEF